MSLRAGSVEDALKNRVLRIDPAADAGHLAIAAVAADTGVADVKACASGIAEEMEALTFDRQ